MAAVYSQLLARAPGFSGGPVDYYTPPPGRLAVVKCITIVHGDVVGSGLDAWVQTQDLTKLVRSTINITFTPAPNWYGGTDLYWGMWVVDSGDVLQLQTVAGTVDFYISGYELTLP